MATPFSLAVNTSQSRAEIVLYQEPVNFIKKDWSREKAHSEVITQEYLELLKQANLQQNQIKKIYCVVGPGSFTGLRVGVSFCKTLAYSLSVPLVAINSLDLLSLSCPFYPKRRIVSVIDAQKNSLFLSVYEDSKKIRKTLVPHLVVPIEKLNQYFTEPTHVCGDALDRYDPFIDPTLKSKMIRDPNCNISQLDNWFLKNFFYDAPCGDHDKELKWDQLQPLYIKASAPEEKLKSK